MIKGYKIKNEKEIYRIEKRKTSAVVPIIVIPFLFIIVIYSVLTLIDFLSIKNMSNQMNENIIICSISLPFFTFAVYTSMSDFFVNVIKTSKHLIIKKGLSRNTYVIPCENIYHIQGIELMARERYYAFNVYLRNGQKISTGNLCSSNDSFKKMKRVLDAKELPKKIIKEYVKKVRSENYYSYKMYNLKGGNIIITFLLMIPLILTLIFGGIILLGIL